MLAMLPAAVDRAEASGGARSRPDGAEEDQYRKQS
jgi:hypothetical protein